MSDLSFRIHSSTTSADIFLFSALSVQKPSIQLAKVSGAITCGRWSKNSTFHLQNFKFWMTSRATLGHISLIILISGFLASKTFPGILECTTL